MSSARHGFFNPCFAVPPRSRLSKKLPCLLCRAESKLPSDGSMKQINKDQMMAKLAAARDYKNKFQKPETSTPQTTSDQDTALMALDQYAIRQAQEETQEFLLAQQQMEAAKSSTAPDNVIDVNREFRSGLGNADQAATWLQTIASQGIVSQIDKNLRPEEFTARKEELKRQQGATIERATSTVRGTRRKFEDLDDYGLARQQDEAEAAMAAERAELAAAKAIAEAEERRRLFGEDDTQATQTQSTAFIDDQSNNDVHKPVVPTWGVFPRPKNISEAYGGGRNLRPGQALESEDQKTEREKRLSTALSNYKKQMGLEVDPAVEAQAQELYEKGESAFKAGRLLAALEFFTSSAELVPLKSKIGGQALLQKAICLDSIGRNSEAYSIYKSLEGHNGPGVSKAAKRFLFGFKAAQKLKVDTMYYGSGGAKAWQGYFDRINASGWAEYRAKEEESEEDSQSARIATAIAAAVVLIPLAFTAVIIIK